MPPAIYLDHNATTPPDPSVIEAVAKASSDAFGNPGSRHSAGRAARKILENSRETIARVLDCQPTEVVFTSGGTEATNLALQGFSTGRQATFLAPLGEHPATEENLKELERRGWSRFTLPIDDQGRLIDSALDAAPWNHIQLATAILAHNETGVIHDLAPLSKRCRDLGVPLHVDAVQAAGRISLSFRDLGATTMAIGAHKFRGPRGIGALIIRDGVRLPRTQFGGHQEGDRRPGTECVALAAGMARALELWHSEGDAYGARLKALRDRLETGLLEKCAPAIVNGSQSQAPRLPNTLNIAFPGCDGEALLVALDLAGICASLGSACASGSAEPSPILIAMGLPTEIYRSSIRFSVGWTNTEEEIYAAIERTSIIVRKLRAS